MADDILRVLLITQAGFTLGLTLTIIVAYFHVWRHANHNRGLLPAHVVAVATAHSMLILWAAIEVHSRIGEAITWRTPYLLTAMVVSDIALFIIMKLQVHRLRASTMTDDVEVTLQHDGETEMATIIPGEEDCPVGLVDPDDPGPADEDEPFTIVDTYVTVQAVRTLVLSVLGLLLVVGVISIAVAFQVTRTNRVLDEGDAMRKQLVQQICDLERRIDSTLPQSVNCEDR